jgi:hypothetical protein
MPKDLARFRNRGNSGSSSSLFLCIRNPGVTAYSCALGATSNAQAPTDPFDFLRLRKQETLTKPPKAAFLSEETLTKPRESPGIRKLKALAEPSQVGRPLTL